MKSKQQISVIYAVLAASLYAINAPISKILLKEIPSTLMAGLLYLGAGIGMSIISIINKRLGHKQVTKKYSKRELPYIISMIILDIAAPILLMLGLSRTTSANASLLNNFEIVATSFIAMILFKESISKRLWGAISLITIASIILSFENISSFSFSSGSLFVLAACICWGFENNCTRVLSKKNSCDIVIIKGLGSGFGSFLIAMFLKEKSDNLAYIIAALILGFVAYGLSIFFYVNAQRELGAAKTSAYYAITPFLGAMLSLIIFKEMPPITFIIALFIMIIGTYFTSTDYNGRVSVQKYADGSKVQNKITKTTKLLDNKGELIQKGYATSLILDYKRKDIKTCKIRLKEWDYYLIQNEDFGVALTVGDNAYIGMISASFIDYKNKKEKTTNVISALSMGKYHMPETSTIGDIVYRDKRVFVSFIHDKDVRKLHMEMKNFDDGADIVISMELSNEPKDSMVIATPFKEDKKAFYYNQKIIGMKASGKVSLKGKTFEFKEDSSFGLLDWGRGVWTYDNTWYWSAGQGLVNGKVFGFNLGYGFGDTSAATENMLFFDGIAHKLEHVVFDIPQNEKNEFDYMKPWKFTSSDQRFEMKFMPILDRSAYISAVVISSNQHQVFGRFTGRAVLDDGTIIEIKDFLAFAERVKNKW